MGIRIKYKNDLRFKCANYDFSSGHCKKIGIFHSDHKKVNGEWVSVDEFCYPVGCSGDPNCEHFSPKEVKK